MSHPSIDVWGRAREKVHPYRIGFSTAMSRQFAVELQSAVDESGAATITGHVEFEEHQQALRNFFRYLNLPKMKDEFVLTASHELRSPLTSVQGFAELLMLERDQLSDKHAKTSKSFWN